MRLIILMSLLILAVPQPSQAVAPQSVLSKRSDLAQQLHHKLCQNSIPTLREAWKHGLYDAQMSGQFFTPKADAPQLSEAQLEQVAMKAASQQAHHGYSGKLCPSGKAWVVTTPGARALVRTTKNTYQLDAQEVATYCRDFYLDFAPAAAGSSRRLSLPEIGAQNPLLTISTELLEPGVLSLTCLPRQPSWQGPVVWYLAPVKGGPHKSPPFHKVQKSKVPTDSPEHLLSWINRLRRGEKLSHLARLPEPMQQTVATLLNTQGVVHDRRRLSSVKSAFSQASAQFLGENRVQGSSFNDIAWLLWNSPPHRKLLLNDRATHIDIQSVPAGREQLFVIVLAKMP